VSGLINQPVAAVAVEKCESRVFSTAFFGRFVVGAKSGPADSLAPKIVYSVNANMVSLRLRIERAGKTFGEERLNLSSADKNALASAVAAKLVDLAGQIPLKSANQ
jgi:hypothetical protein